VGADRRAAVHLGNERSGQDGTIECLQASAACCCQRGRLAADERSVGGALVVE